MLKGSGSASPRACYKSLHLAVYTRKASSKSSKWLKRQQTDPYARHKSAPRGPRLDDGHVLVSRAGHKLAEMDAKHKILQPTSIVCDLGCSPGGWLEYAHKKVSQRGFAVGVDLVNVQLDVDVPFIKGDFLDPKTHDALAARLQEAGKKHVDVVLSDMLHAVTGDRDVDGSRSIELVRAAMAFALKHFIPEQGTLLAKFYRGAEADEFIKQEVSPVFTRVQIVKPEASRKQSKEAYLLARRSPPRAADESKHPVLDTLSLGVADALT